MHDNLIIKLFQDKNGKISSRKLSKFIKSADYPNILSYLKNRYSDNAADFSLYIILYRIFNKIDKWPVCEICGKPVEFYRQKFNRVCSVKCRTILTKQTMKDRYGYTCCWQVPEIHQKTIDKSIELYGKDELKRRRENTIKERYGSDNVFSKDSSIRTEIWQVFKDKYGVNNPRHISGIEDKIKKTNREKYGCDYGLSSSIVINKRIQTLHERYGTDIDNVFQIPEIKNRIASYWQFEFNCKGPTSEGSPFREKFIDKIPDILSKSMETKKKNNTFESSKTEDLFYDLLCAVFGQNDIIRQYKSDDYPFHADFYIKSKYLYIEYNGTWTHGPRLFTETENDLKRLAHLNEKAETSKYYKEAVTTWTVRDTVKWKTAINNNLNFLMIYNMKPGINETDNDIILGFINKFSKDSRNQIKIGEYE